MEITFEGFIVDVEDDRFTMVVFGDKVKHVIANYGEFDFVPLIGKDRVKVKAGVWKKFALGRTFPELMNFGNHNVSVTAKLRKNTFIKNGIKSTSLSLVMQNIRVTDAETDTVLMLAHGTSMLAHGISDNTVLAHGTSMLAHGISDNTVPVNEIPPFTNYKH